MIEFLSQIDSRNLMHIRNLRRLPRNNSDAYVPTMKVRSSLAMVNRFACKIKTTSNTNIYEIQGCQTVVKADIKSIRKNKYILPAVQASNIWFNASVCGITLWASDILMCKQKTYTYNLRQMIRWRSSGEGKGKNFPCEAKQLWNIANFQLSNQENWFLTRSRQMLCDWYIAMKPRQY